MTGLHPILTTLVLGPTGVLIGAIGFALLATGLVWREGAKKDRKKRITETALFGLIGVIVAAIVPSLIALPEELKIEIRSWGVFTALAMFAGLYVQQRFAKRIGVDRERIFDIWLFGGISGLILGRAIHVIGNWELYRAMPRGALYFWDGGLVFLGLLLGYLGFALFSVIKHRLPAATFDALAIGLPFGHALGRIGCFLAGCCFGNETALPIGVAFGEGSIALHALITSGAIDPHATHTMPLHPTQLYEAFAELSIFGALLARIRKPHGAGTIACMYLALYAPIRIALEVVRADPERTYLLSWLSESQAISIVLLLIGAIGWWRLERKNQALEALGRNEGSSMSKSMVM